MRRTYVQSGYAEPPPEAPNWLRRLTGPQWAIPLCADRSGVQLSVGIADNVLDMRIIGGQLVLPATGGQLDFSLMGVPLRFPTGLPSARWKPCVMCTRPRRDASARCRWRSTS